MESGEVQLIYVVDDEKIISATLAAILNQAGFEGVGFIGPSDVLEASKLRRPDVLISDVIMPGMNGIELGIEFRNRYPYTRVILFSGQTGTIALLDLAEQQGHHFEILAKPIHPTEIIETLRGKRVRSAEAQASSASAFESQTMTS